MKKKANGRHSCPDTARASFEISHRNALLGERVVVLLLITFIISPACVGGSFEREVVGQAVTISTVTTGKIYTARR